MKIDTIYDVLKRARWKRFTFCFEAELQEYETLMFAPELLQSFIPFHPMTSPNTSEKKDFCGSSLFYKKVKVFQGKKDPEFLEFAKMAKSAIYHCTCYAVKGNNSAVHSVLF